MKVKGEAGGSSSSPPGSAKRSLPEDNDGGEATVSANKKLRVDFVGKGRVGSEEPPLVDVRSRA